MTPDLSESHRVVVSRDQMSTTVSGEVVILGTRDAAYYGLDGVGARIWELLQEPRRIGEIADTLCAEYEVTRPTALNDTVALVASLVEHGLVVVADRADS